MLGKRQKTLDFFKSLEDNRQSTIDNRTIDKLIIISFSPIVTIQDEMEVYRPIYGRVSLQ